MTDAYLSPPDGSFACTTGDPCGECLLCARAAALARRLRRREEAEEEGREWINPSEFEPVIRNPKP